MQVKKAEMIQNGLLTLKTQLGKCLLQWRNIEEEREFTKLNDEVSEINQNIEDEKRNFMKKIEKSEVEETDIQNFDKFVNNQGKNATEAQQKVIKYMKKLGVR